MEWKQRREGGREGVVSPLNFTLFTERPSVDKKTKRKEFLKTKNNNNNTKTSSSSVAVEGTTSET